MAFQNFYPNLAGVRATFRDGILNAISPSEAPNIVVIGTASKGRSYTVVGDSGSASLVSEFGTAKPLTRDASLVRNALGGNRTIGLMKVGGKKSHFVIKKELSAYYEKALELIISCNRTEDDYLSKVKLILLPFEEAGAVRQRAILIDSDNNFLFDSESLLIANSNQFDVQFNQEFGIDNIFFTPDIITAGGNNATITCSAMLSVEAFTKDQLDSLPTLDSTTILDQIFKFATNSKSSVGTALSDNTSYYSEKIAGDSGTSFQSMNRLYGAGEMMYDILREFNSALFVASEWRADVVSQPITSLTVDTAESFNYDKDALGYMWKKSYRGISYPFIFGRKNAVDSSGILSALNTEFDSADSNLKFKFTSEEQRKLGDLLNLVEFHFHKGETIDASECIEIFPNVKGRIECHINVLADEPAYIVTPFASVKVVDHAEVANNYVHRFRPSLVNGSLNLSNSISLKESSVLSDPFVMTPFDLTGELIPEEVVSELLIWSTTTAPAVLPTSFDKTHIREINLAHQMGQLAYKASTTYSSTMAIVGLTSCPDGTAQSARWAGTMPTYTIDSLGVVKVSKDGSGILGNKFLYGQKNYRNDMAYGGFILTTGNLLPDAEPYGIDDTDEALDAGGYPIDLGKYLIIVGATGTKTIQVSGNTASNAMIYTTALPNQETSRGNLAAAVAAKIFQNQENQEPIGPVNGVLSTQVTSIVNMPATILNSLAIGRIVMCDPKNNSISNLRTAALPTSDYTRVSTIRVANRLLSNVRDIAVKYLGSNFSLALQSLQSEIDGYLRSEVGQNMIQGTPSPFAQVFASKVDQISGKLNVRLRFTPPFALESIQVDIAVQPPTGI